MTNACIVKNTISIQCKKIVLQKIMTQRPIEKDNRKRGQFTKRTIQILDGDTCQIFTQKGIVLL